MTRAITSRFCSPGGTLSPNTRMYGVFSFCARSMKRRALVQLRLPHLRIAFVHPCRGAQIADLQSERIEVLDGLVSPAPLNSGKAGRSIFISMPRSSIAA